MDLLCDDCEYRIGNEDEAKCFCRKVCKEPDFCAIVNHNNNCIYYEPSDDARSGCLLIAAFIAVTLLFLT